MLRETKVSETGNEKWIEKFKDAQRWVKCVLISLFPSRHSSLYFSKGKTLLHLDRIFHRVWVWVIVSNRLTFFVWKGRGGGRSEWVRGEGYHDNSWLLPLFSLSFLVRRYQKHPSSWIHLYSQQAAYSCFFSFSLPSLFSMKIALINFFIAFEKVGTLKLCERGMEREGGLPIAGLHLKYVLFSLSLSLLLLNTPSSGRRWTEQIVVKVMKGEKKILRVY